MAVNGKEGLVGNGEAKADLQSALSKRNAEGDMSICHLEKMEMGNLGTHIATRFFWSK